MFCSLRESKQQWCNGFTGDEAQTSWPQVWKAFHTFLFGKQDLFHYSPEKVRGGEQNTLQPNCMLTGITKYTAMILGQYRSTESQIVSVTHVLKAHLPKTSPQRKSRKKLPHFLSWTAKQSNILGPMSLAQCYYWKMVWGSHRSPSCHLCVRAVSFMI